MGGEKCNGRQFIFFGCVGGQKPKTCGTIEEKLFIMFFPTNNSFLFSSRSPKLSIEYKKNFENNKLFLIQYRKLLMLLFTSEIVFPKLHIVGNACAILQKLFSLGKRVRLRKTMEA